MGLKQKFNKFYDELRDWVWDHGVDTLEALLYVLFILAFLSLYACTTNKHVESAYSRSEVSDKIEIAINRDSSVSSEIFSGITQFQTYQSGQWEWTFFDTSITETDGSHPVAAIAKNSYSNESYNSTETERANHNLTISTKQDSAASGSFSTINNSQVLKEEKHPPENLTWKLKIAGFFIYLTAFLLFDWGFFKGFFSKSFFKCIKFLITYSIDFVRKQKQ